MGFTSTIKQAGLRAASSLMGSKATILVMGNTVEQIPVQFNPAEYQITDGTAYNQKPRRKNDEPLLDFNGVSLSTLRVQLIFNSAEFTSAASLIKAGMALFTDEGPEDISKTISKISALTRIDGRTVSLIQCICPVMTAVFSFFMLGEHLSVAGMAGAIIIIGCITAGAVIPEDTDRIS